MKHITLSFHEEEFEQIKALANNELIPPEILCRRIINREVRKETNNNG